MDIPINYLESIVELFKRFGVKSQTMDDIARQLGISKKTLYKYFSDKNDLVVKSMDFIIQLDCKHMDEIKRQKLNAIDENFSVSRHVLNQFKDIHPSVWYDLNRYHPKAMKIMDDFTHNVIFNWVCDNMKRGIEEGLYREDLQIPIIGGIYISRIKDFFNPLIFDNNRYSFADIYMETFRYHIRGIASEKGLEVLKEKVNQTKIIKNEF